MKNRCEWCLNDNDYIKYHDTEWGVPQYNDETLFELLILETMQAGLSWLTILKKREYFRIELDNFDYSRICKYNQDKINELLSNKKLIRNKNKIFSIINNAKCFIEIQNEFKSFKNYIWGFVNFTPIINKWTNISEIPARNNLSDLISKDLKNRGLQFIGSKIIYSYLQAIGIINDHIINCFRYQEIIDNYKSTTNNKI